MEINLPRWTLAADVDFRRWIFGFLDGVVIEQPAALAAEHREVASAVSALYATATHPTAAPLPNHP